MAAVEAMMLGVPVITSDFPASHEFIKDGITGHHFPIGDADALARTIIWHMQNPTESLAMAEAGQRVALIHYQPERIAKIHLDLYLDCMSIA
ncbi:hypothetical protein GCM10023156_30660 [Novipirellula rosea]|uniref:Glycosyl transferase family 1 domain-containing protein n=2 Tax=Novipirellula rosea TaxID=1031540 RepID=A0ABP8MW84_9BACT